MKVFQTSTERLTELRQESDKKAFDYERMIQNLIEKNLSVIFPSMEFLTSEYQIDSLRPDSIAFDNDRKSFVIIEYKNVKHKGVVDQGMSYYQLLQEKREAFVLLYHKIKGKILDTENDINWDETRVIFISPHFTIHQKRASQSVDLPIELYEIARFERGIITFNKVEKETEGLEQKHKKSPIIRLDEYSEEDYLAGKYSKSGKNLNPNTKKLWFTIKNKILDEFSDLEFQQKKKYAGFYSKQDGSAICTLDARNSKIWLCYSIRKNQKIITENEFVKDVSHKGHWGLGDFQSEMRSDKDIEKALPLIRKVYEFKNR